MSRVAIIAGAALAAIWASPALAHVGLGTGSSFMSGLTHPLGGLDHLAAMVAVGIWAAVNGGRRLWMWPLIFVATMLVGALVGLQGIVVPYVEPAIAVSVLVLGLLAALEMKAPTWAGASLIAISALAHGHAHGTELAGASAAPYIAGFVIATAALHGVGILIAMVGLRIVGITPARAVGAAAAVAGVILIVGRNAV